MSSSIAQIYQDEEYYNEICRLLKISPEEVRMYAHLSDLQREYGVRGYYDLLGVAMKIDKERTICVGDKVKLVKTHPAHNPALKGMLNTTIGYVELITENYRGVEAHVVFGDHFYDPSFWVNVKYLEKVN